MGKLVPEGLDIAEVMSEELPAVVGEGGGWEVIVALRREVCQHSYSFLKGHWANTLL